MISDLDYLTAEYGITIRREQDHVSVVRGNWHRRFADDPFGTVSRVVLHKLRETFQVPDTCPTAPLSQLGYRVNVPATIRDADVAAIIDTIRASDPGTADLAHEQHARLVDDPMAYYQLFNIISEHFYEARLAGGDDGFEPFATKDQLVDVMFGIARLSVKLPAPNPHIQELLGKIYPEGKWHQNEFLLPRNNLSPVGVPVAIDLEGIGEAFQYKPEQLHAVTQPLVNPPHQQPGTSDAFVAPTINDVVDASGDPDVAEAIEHVLHYIGEDINSMSRPEKAIAKYGSTKGQYFFENKVSSNAKRQVAKCLPPEASTEGIPPAQWLEVIANFIQKKTRFAQLERKELLLLAAGRTVCMKSQVHIGNLWRKVEDAE